MSDRPILFSAPMVQALLAGRKTQTRRIIKPQPVVHENGAWSWEGRNGGFVGAMGTHVDDHFPESAVHWNRIQPGDRLYVREHWRTTYGLDWRVEALDRPLRPVEFDPKTTPIEYLADGENELGGKDRRAMHMPRWASRLTLIVTDVRVERLQDISEEDAIAEGIEFNPRWDPVGQCKWRHYGKESAGVYPPSTSYGTLWDSINGPGSWDADPWVAAYTFSVIKQNIDEIEKAAA